MNLSTWKPVFNFSGKPFSLRNQKFLLDKRKWKRKQQKVRAFHHQPTEAAISKAVVWMITLTWNSSEMFNTIRAFFCPPTISNWWHVCWWWVLVIQDCGTLNYTSTKIKRTKSLLGSGISRNFVCGGFNKFSWGQRTERTGIWGQWPPSQGFWRQL
jgi:hypothetical protein